MDHRAITAAVVQLRRRDSRLNPSWERVSSWFGESKADGGAVTGWLYFGVNGSDVCGGEM